MKPVTFYTSLSGINEGKPVALDTSQSANHYNSVLSAVGGNHCVNHCSQVTLDMFHFLNDRYTSIADTPNSDMFIAYTSNTDVEARPSVPAASC